MLTARDGSTQRRTMGIVAAMAFAIPLSLLAIRDLQIQPEEAQRLAETDPARRLSDWNQLQFPDTDSLLVTWEGSTLDDPRIGPFTEALLGQTDADGVRRGGAPEIAAVTTPGDMLQRLTAQGIEAEEAARRLTGTYIGVGGLKLKLTDAGRDNVETTTHRLVRLVRDNLGIELSVSGPVETWSSEASEGEAVAAPALEIREHDLQITWKGFHPRAAIAANVRSQALALTDFPTAEEPGGRKLVEECFIEAGTPIGIEVALSQAGAADVSVAVQAIRHAATVAELPELHIAGARLARVEEMRAAQRIAWNVAAAKLTQRSLPITVVLVMCVLTCVLLRSVKAGAIVSTLSLAAALLTAALLRMNGTFIDPIHAALPLLAGLLMLAGGMQIAGSSRDGMTRTGAVAAVRYAAIVAAIVLLPLMISSTPPVRHFGTFGVMSILVVVFLGAVALPSLLPIPGPTTARTAEGGWRTFAEIITRRPRLTTSLCVLALLIGAAGAARARVASSEIRTFPADSRLADDTSFIEDNLTGTSPLDVIVRFSPDCRNGLRFIERAEIVRVAEQAVASHPAIAGTVSLADMLPKTEVLAADAPTRQRVMFNRRSNEVEEQVRSGAIAGSEAFLQTADQNRDWQVAGDSRLTRIDDELWRISTTARLSADVSVPLVAQEIDASVKEVLRRHPGVDHVVAGPAIIGDAVRHAMLKSFGKTMGLACFVMFVAMIWLVRTPTAFLIGTLINLLPIACVAGIAALKGNHIDVSLMLSALMALILSAHASVQMLFQFRTGIQSGLAHADAARRALAECGPGFWRLSIASVGGLLMLLPAETVAVRSFAGLLASMIAVSQLATLVLLPSLLSGRCGRWLQSALRTAPPVASEEIPSPHVRFEPAAREVVRNAV